MAPKENLQQNSTLGRRSYLKGFGGGLFGGSLVSSARNVTGSSPESGDWPVARGDLANSQNNRNSKPPKGVLPLIDGYNIYKKWEFDVDGGYQFSPLVADDKVFAVGENRIHALEPDSGEELWYTDVNRRISCLPAITNRSLIVGNEIGEIFSLDTETGKKNWKTTLTDESLLPSAEITPTAPPTVSGNKVYVTGLGKVYALDVDSGEEKWRVETEGSLQTAPALVENPRLAPSTLVIRSHQFETEGDKIFAINTNTGESLWQFSTEKTTYSPPVIRDNVAIINSKLEGNSKLSYVMLRNGELAGEFNTDKNWLSGPAVSHDGEIVVTHSDNDSQKDYLVWNRYRGETRWQTEVKDFGLPMIVGDTVLGARGSMLTGLDLENGNKLWEVDLLSRYSNVNISSAVCVDGKIYGRDTAGSVYAFESRNIPTGIVAGTIGLGSVAVLWRKLKG